MPKAKDTLTGGTGDVNPQLYRLAVSLASGAAAAPSLSSTGSATTFPLPIPKYPGGANKSLVVELLKVRWTVGFGSTNASGTSFNIAVNATLMTSGNTVPGTLNQGNILDNFNAEQIVTVTTAVPPQYGLFILQPASDSPAFHDLTDGAGHGILVATDNIVLAADLSWQNLAVANAFTAAVECDLFYRFKEVTLQEYIGIVQSQQNVV